MWRMWLFFAASISRRRTLCIEHMLIRFYLDIWIIFRHILMAKIAGAPSIHAIFISNLLGNHLHTAGTNMCDGKWFDSQWFVVTVVTVCHCSPNWFDLEPRGFSSNWFDLEPRGLSRFKTLSCNRLRVWSLLSSFSWTPSLAGFSLWDGVIHILVFQGISALAFAIPGKLTVHCWTDPKSLYKTV